MELFLDTDIEQFFEIKDPAKFKNPPYPTSEVYSFGKYIREYGRYPLQLPLCINTDHGASGANQIYEHEIRSDAPVQFYHVPETVELWRGRFKKPCYVLFSPFVFYRRHNNIQQLENAKGIIAFPAHTTPDIDDLSNIEEYISNLNALPEQYHPVSICLHYHDVRKGLHKAFLKKGYRVFCAGNPFDYSFAKNFYNILRQHKYSTSNLVMSCLFYSVEMGIPHFIYGNPPMLINKSDENLGKGKYDLLGIPKIKGITDMFQGPFDKITDEQMALVNHELGITKGIPRNKMSYILYKSLFLFMIKRAKAGMLNKISYARKTYAYGKFIIKKRIIPQKIEEAVIVDKQLISLLTLYKLKTANYTESELWGKPIRITDSFWYLHSLREIFVEEVYKFNTSNDSPYILDCGSNIGLSVIYFKKLFPKARIVAFEPDDQICGLLQSNLKAFGHGDVVVENKAVWTKETVLEFSSNGALGGRINDKEDISGSSNPTVKVEAVRLANYLTEEVDFLKIDIEGPEVEVLKDCRHLLGKVKNIFVEYHSDPSKEQELDVLLTILKDAHFKVYIKEAWNNLPYPFLRNNYDPFYDLQLNIFAYRS
jgi:FkbM family methyltransferase